MTFKERIGCMLVACAVGSFILTCIVGLVNICQVVIPWMKTGQWGEVSTVEDITGKWEVSDDAWHIKGIVAVANRGNTGMWFLSGISIGYMVLFVGDADFGRLNHHNPPRK